MFVFDMSSLTDISCFCDTQVDPFSPSGRPVEYKSVFCGINFSQASTFHTVFGTGLSSLRSQIDKMK